jgi:hypothetical protein
VAVSTRRHLITAVTLGVLLGILLVMGGLGIKQALKPFPSGKKAGSPTCSSKQKQVQRVLTRKDVQVSVFNAGDRSGLASETLQKVQKAGFIGGNSGNAPGTAQVPRAAVWTTKENDYSAKLVALAFGPHTPVVVTTTDLGPGIDVLVGNKFKGLDGKAPRQITLPKPIQTCVQVS